MHVAATQIDRYKHAPSRILPRQMSPVKPMHCRSSLPLPWLPYARCSDTHIPYARCSDTRESFLIPSHILIRVNRNEGRPGSDRFNRTDSALKNPHHQVVIPEPLAEPLRWCPMLSVKRNEGRPRGRCALIPRRRILQQFWVTQNVTVSALSWYNTDPYELKKWVCTRMVTCWYQNWTRNPKWMCFQCGDSERG
jgi:hypothetical protein